MKIASYVRTDETYALRVKEDDSTEKIYVGNNLEWSDVKTGERCTQGTAGLLFILWQEKLQKERGIGSKALKEK